MYDIPMVEIKKSFFNRDALGVAEDLLGKLLIRKVERKTIQARIIETEAYIGEEDKACHARFGKTKRNAVMYESGGKIYVYLCYGIHNLLNIVTGDKDHPEAVLIRKVKLEDGSELGPGSLTKFLNIDRSLSERNLGGELYIADDGFKVKQILKDKRVGIGYAEEYADKPWRFIAKLPH